MIYSTDVLNDILNRQVTVKLHLNHTIYLSNPGMLSIYTIFVKLETLSFQMGAIKLPCSHDYVRNSHKHKRLTDKYHYNI